MKWYREENFPVTIVRPSHTYDERRVPLGVEGKNGSWQVPGPYAARETCDFSRRRDDAVDGYA